MVVIIGVDLTVPIITDWQVCSYFHHLTCKPFNPAVVEGGFR